MSVGKYCLYQMKNTPGNADYLYRPYEYLYSHRVIVHVSRYDKVYEAVLLNEMPITSIRDALLKKPKRTFSNRALGTGDVITIEFPEKVECYYFDSVGMVPVKEFFSELASEGSRITPTTKNYSLQGKSGLWQTVDFVTVDDRMFFLMESIELGQYAANVIADSEGHIITDENRNGFDQKAMREIRNYLHPESKTIIVSKQPHGKPPMEQHQKYFENGTYERSGSSEVTGEQNYNMIDGTNNNAKKPGERESVRARLKQKLALIHGEPEMSAELVRKP